MNSMKKLRTTIAITLVACVGHLMAQCPNVSRPGIHVVKKGETLYGIARQYDQNIADICAWNHIKIGEILEACRELSVSSSQLTAEKDGTVSVSTVQTTTQKTRDAQVKTVEFDMDQLPIDQREPTNRETERTAIETSTDQAPVTHSTPPAQAYVKQSNELHIVKRGEKIAGLARLYGYTEERFREFNGLNETEEVEEGRHLRSNDCICSGNAAPTRDKWSDGRPSSILETPGATKPVADTEVEKQMQPMAPVENWNDKETLEREKPAPSPVAPKSTSGQSGVSFMRPDENAMLAEINLMRTNPTGYIPHVEEFISYLKSDWGGQGISAARELIDQLRRTPPLQSLEASECLYRTVKKHGDYYRETGRELDHVGRGGSNIGDRIKADCPDYADGSENLSLGVGDIRKIILWLLVDNGLPDRGHRKNLLNPKFKYCACYNAGTIGDWNDNWVQNFGN